ncbi:MAG: DUF697 domain-containing protein [Synechococcus sp.]
MLPVPSLGSLIAQPKALRPVVIAGAGLVVTQWALADLLHVPGGGIAFVALGGGLWWLSRPTKPPGFESPSSLQGWLKRCDVVMDHFDEFEAQIGTPPSRLQRQQALDRLLDRSHPLSVGVVGSEGVTLPESDRLQQALSGPHALSLCVGHALPSISDTWAWPQALQEQDALIFVLPLPLRAADLLRLQQVPDRQPVWLVVHQSQLSAQSGSTHQALLTQLPERWHQRLLVWDGTAEQLRSVLMPVRQLLLQPQQGRDLTRQRLIETLHCQWQAELECLRRDRFRALLQRSQWIVAGAVVASPLPSTDLLAVAVGNGLMLKEMGVIWGCRCTSDVLQVATKHLAGAALAQGVVEWSGQALLGFAKLEGSTWLAAGVMQALSAAYLTRVVGASMADWLALYAGVAEPDLALLKRQAPLLVAQAAERERLDWQGFLQQAGRWVQDQGAAAPA